MFVFPSALTTLLPTFLHDSVADSESLTVNLPQSLTIPSNMISTIEKVKKTVNEFNGEKISSSDIRKSNSNHILFEFFPFDITSLIYNYLTLSDKNSLSKTCKRLNAYFHQIDSLHLQNRTIHEKNFLPLIKRKSKNLSELSIINVFGFKNLSKESIESGLKDVKFERLKSLSFSKNRERFFVVELIRILSESVTFNLTHLDLSYICYFDEKDVIKEKLVQLIKCKSLKNLEFLNIEGNNLGVKNTAYPVVPKILNSLWLRNS